MKKVKVYKALMVEDYVHHTVVVKAKKLKITVSEYIYNLCKKNNK